MGKLFEDGSFVKIVYDIEKQMQRKTLNVKYEWRKFLQTK